MKNFLIQTRYGVVALVAMMLLMLGVGSAMALMSDHDCAYCHSLHGAPGFTLLNQPSEANLILTAEMVCLSCHGPLGSSSLTADVHSSAISGATINRISCIECHDAHDHQQNVNGVDNLNMVLETITVMTTLGDLDAVVFADKDYTDDSSHDYSHPDASGICQVCHTLTKFQRNDGFKSGHQLGGVCMNCHPHSNGFDKL